MFCSKCGKELAEDAKFCPNCAAPVGQEPQPETAPSTSGTPSPSSPKPQTVIVKKRPGCFTRIAQGFGILIVIGLISSFINGFGGGDTDSTSSDNSTNNEADLDIEWPSLNEIAGGSAEDLTFPDACLALQENLFQSEVFADSADKMAELNALEGAYEASDFVEANSWVASVAGQSPLTALDRAVADELKSLLSSSSVENASLILSDNIPLYNIMKTQLTPLVKADCDPDGLYEELLEFSRKAKNTQSLANSKPWFPDDFNAYPGNPNVAYKFADRRCSYSSARCAHVDIMTRFGADNLYMEVNFLDADGSYVDYSNDTARNLDAGQIAKLEFVSFSDGAQRFQLGDISVY